MFEGVFLYFLKGEWLRERFDFDLFLQRGYHLELFKRG